MTDRTKTLLVISWLVAVFPFTGLGYGSDGDAWRVARAAQEMWRGGHYITSRSTGFPLFEIMVVPLAHLGGWHLSNLLALSFGLVLLFGLFRLGAIGNLRHPLITTAVIAFSPLVVKNSSSTMDYVPALAILLWSCVAAQERRWTLGAMLAGIACGFRPSSGLYLFALLAGAWRDRAGVKTLLAIAGVTILSALVAYSPVLLTRGIPDPSTSIRLQHGIQAAIAAFNFLRVFGIAQTAVLAAVLTGSMRTARRIEPGYFRTPHFAFHGAVIAAWVLLFAMMPDEPEYLLPAALSLILVADRIVPRPLYVAVVIAVLSYHVIQLDALGGESGNRRVHLSVRSGFTVDDVQDRRFKLSTRRAATGYRAPQPTVLMFGAAWIPTANERWTYDPDSRMYRQREGDLFLSEIILDTQRLRELKDRGFRLCVWRGAKWEYMRTPDRGWRAYVEVVDDLGCFFGVPLEGRSLSVR